MNSKIAIWGSFNYGNFGDDLMAILFAKEVIKNGGIPIVYRLDKKIAADYGIATTVSVDELLDGVNAVIIGGGALFTRESWLRVHLRKITRDFEFDFKELYKRCMLKKIPIFPLSIGGDGGGTIVGMPKWHYRLFSSNLCQKGTVRLPDCLTIGKLLNIDMEFHPDVVFATDYCFNIKKNKLNNSKLNIGVNLKKTDKLLIDLIENIASDKTCPFCFHFIKTHLPAYPTNYEYLPKGECENIKIHQYKNLEETINFFASLDLLITVKLHIGVTSLSVGTPFISFNGKDKTKSMLRSIDAAGCIYSKLQISDLKNFIVALNHDKINKLYNFNKIEEIKKEAVKHLQATRYSFTV